MSDIEQLVAPFWSKEGIAVLNQDFLDYRPPVWADAFLADPPYSRAGAIHTGRSSMVGRASDTAGSDQFWLYWFKAVALKLVQVTRVSGHGFVFCDYRTINLIERAFAATDSGWAVTQCLVWDRGSIGLGSPFRACHELVAFARGPRFSWAGSKAIGNVLRFRWPYGEHEHHPAEKPVSLLRFLVEETTRIDDVVLDPFTGSGSSLVACKQARRQAIGVEVDEALCQVAADRLQQDSMVLPLEVT